MLEVKWKVQYYHLYLYHNLVSILVMLEVKWKGIPKHYFIQYKGSFNPCYVGSKMERMYFVFKSTQKMMFQSLLCWK